MRCDGGGLARRRVEAGPGKSGGMQNWAIHHRKALVAAGGFAAALFIASCLAEPFGPFPVERDILLGLRQAADAARVAGPEWFGAFMQHATVFGGRPFLTVLTSLVVAALALRRKWRLALLTIAVALGQSIVIDESKTLFARPRPDIVPRLDAISNFSFPSGHAASSASIYFWLAILAASATGSKTARTAIFVGAAAAAFVVGMSRVVLGVHYPSDVLAGWSFGVAWTSCLAAIALHDETRDDLTRK